MTTHEPRTGDDDQPSVPMAPDDVQQSISALLHDAARKDDAALRMPADVEANIRNALRAERLAQEKPAARAASESTGARPQTVIPLPSRPRAQAPEQSAGSQAATAVPVPNARVSSASHSPQSEGASVASLAEHRGRKGSRGRMLIGLGAAAAVLIGTVGVWHQSTNQHSAGGPQATGDVRVTDSNTAYETTTFTRQSAKLTSASYPELTQQHATKAGLGTLPSQEQLTACVNSLATFLHGNPDKIYADFGTYNGQKSLIVVIDHDGKKTAWALNRGALRHSCQNKKDVLKAATPLEA